MAYLRSHVVGDVVNITKQESPAHGEKSARSWYVVQVLAVGSYDKMALVDITFDEEPKGVKRGDYVRVDVQVQADKMYVNGRSIVVNKTQG